MFEEKKRLKKLSSEELREEALLSLSDGIRYIAGEIAIIKRSYVLEFGTEEEFDKAFNREMDRAYGKVRHMSKKDIALRTLLKIMENQALRFDIEEEDKDA